jgi:hypothetical protein
VKTLVLYDDTGYIYMQMTGTYRIPQAGLNYLEIEIPDGKILKSIDINVTPNIPVYENMPVPEVQVIKQQLQETQELLAEYINNKYNALIND